MNIGFIHRLILAILIEKLAHTHGKTLNVMKAQIFLHGWASGHLLIGFHLFYFILPEITVNISFLFLAQMGAHYGHCSISHGFFLLKYILEIVQYLYL